MVTAAMKLKDACSLKEKLWEPRWHIKKQRQYFANNGPSDQSYIFPVVMYGCEDWTIEKAECQRIDVFELWCWRRLLQVPWTAKRSNQSAPKEIGPQYSLEGLMLKLKLQYSDHLMLTTDSLENTLMLGNLKAGREGKGRGWDGWMASLTWWTWVCLSSRSWWWTRKPDVLQSIWSQIFG